MATCRGGGRDRLRSAARRVDGSRAEVAGVPCCDGRHDPGGGRCVQRAREDVATGLDVALAERQVDDVHPVPHGGFDRGRELRRVAVEPELARIAHRLVVAEILARSDARQVDPGAADRAVVTCGDARDVRAVLGRALVERQSGGRVRRAGRRERARDDYLRRRVRGLSLRKPRWIAVARGAEERVRLVDPVVDDPDLHPLAGGCERRAPDGGSADQLRRAVEELVVRISRPHASHAGDLREPVEAVLRHDHREAVQDDAVLPASPGHRERRTDPVGDEVLRRRQAGEVRAARRRAEEQPLRAREG